MRVLLDTDVVLDYALGREPFAQNAGKLLELNAQGAFDGYVSGITPINVFYVARKMLGRDKVRQILADFLLAFRVCPIDRSILTDAFALPVTDYEDAVQCTSAIASELDAIVTRNLKDYENAPLPVLSPAAFLNQLVSPEE